MDKSITYKIFYNEEIESWIVESEDLQWLGMASDKDLEGENKDIAAAMALLDLMGYGWNVDIED